MNAFDYYSCLLQIGKKYNLPDQISRYIFDFQKKDIQTLVNYNYLNDRISTNESRETDLFIFHRQELPFKIMTIEEAALWIESIMKEKGMNYVFNRFCCKLNEDIPPMGVVFGRRLNRGELRLGTNRSRI